MDQWGHVQDSLLHLESGSFSVLHLWTPAGFCGHRYPAAGLLVQLLPSEARVPHYTPSQHQGPVRYLAGQVAGQQCGGVSYGSSSSACKYSSIGKLKAEMRTRIENLAARQLRRFHFK